jgi:hypothetical protein
MESGLRRVALGLEQPKMRKKERKRLHIGKPTYEHQDP